MEKDNTVGIRDRLWQIDKTRFRNTLENQTRFAKAQREWPAAYAASGPRWPSSGKHYYGGIDSYFGLEPPLFVFAANRRQSAL
jgi:hypothetical protein